MSGGEAQRIRLASQIGSGLVGVMYILDEPSIGLHQRDNQRLLDTLMNLRNLGNTVLVVEHDSEAIMAADYVVDLGPGAGVHGGQVVAQGTPKEICANAASLTGQYLSGKREIPLPSERRDFDPQLVLRIVGARGNNLKGVDVEIPVGLMTCVTGVSAAPARARSSTTRSIESRPRTSTAAPRSPRLTPKRRASSTSTTSSTSRRPRSAARRARTPPRTAAC